MLQFLNGFFLVFHTGLVIFNCAGWAFRRTRRAHLATMGLTLFSWVVLGGWRGAGYCICTDWHFQVRQALGYHDRADTYIQFLVQELTGWMPPAEPTRIVTAVVFVVCGALTVALNLRDRAQAQGREGAALSH